MYVAQDDVLRRRHVEIKRAITQGISQDGRKMKPPMAHPLYARLTDADLDAIVAYIRLVPLRE